LWGGPIFSSVFYFRSVICFYLLIIIMGAIMAFQK
jgi:hypothetical protein